MSTPKVFISYRREDCRGEADHLCEKLEDRFGPENVFYDVNSINPGSNYVDILEEQVAQCNVLLALIGKGWIAAENEDGQRLFDENDFVRKEITSAMDQGIKVVPLLLQEAEMPTPDQLPNELHKFCEQQATKVRPRPDFKKDVETLIKHLERVEKERVKLAEGKPSPVSPETVKKLAVSAGGCSLTFTMAAVAGVLVIGLMSLMTFTGESPSLRPSPAVDPQTQIFGQAVRDSLNEHERGLVKADYQKVKKLDLRGKGLMDLKFLSKCPGLGTLYLSGNKISDLSSLPVLSKLEKLDLSQNQIIDFTPLEKFSSLKELVIEGNPGASKSTKDALKAKIPGITFPKTLSK